MKLTLYNLKNKVSGAMAVFKDGKFDMIMVECEGKFADDSLTEYGWSTAAEFAKSNKGKTMYPISLIKEPTDEKNQKLV